MDTQRLESTVQALIAPGKGILAIDESGATCKKRFDSIQVETTLENRRAYRDLLMTVPGGGDFVSGVILYDETIRQASSDGVLFPQVLERQGIVPGIKVDAGAKELALHPGEKITEGLDGLRERIADYVALGARFAKWRAVITIGDRIPSDACLDTNAHALARYAALCQEGGLVPIVEPEVLMDGDHSIERCERVTDATLHRVFSELRRQGVAPEFMLLKASMVLAGAKSSEPASIEAVADATVRCLKRHVPAAVPGIVFLSGGQSSEVATAHLNAMNRMGALPWRLSFSFGRALQDSALKTWRGSAANVKAAQNALYHREKMNSAACCGRWTPDMEKEAQAA